MRKNYHVWLPQLIDTIPNAAKRNRISMYSLALEAWRRGLLVNFYTAKVDGIFDIKYSISDSYKTHHFFGSCGDLNTEEAVQICHDKVKTKQLLNKSGINVPMGRQFNIQTDSHEILDYANEVNYPVVLKPLNASGGRGVFVNLASEKELLDALTFIEKKLPYQDIIMEKYVEGKEVRVYVLADKVLSAVHRKPAHIIGDGIKNISELIEEKNEIRKKTPTLYYRPIKIDASLTKRLKKMGYSMDDIPKKNELIYLRETSNISTGGEPFEVTHLLTDSHKETAVNVIKSIPGLVHGGIDMIINNENYSILEVNAQPGLGSHLFPLDGEAVDIPKYLIDYYFPETLDIKTADSNIYFDFNTVLDVLNNTGLNEVTIGQINKNVWQTKRYLVKAIFEPIRYYNWIRNKMFEKKLIGSMTKLDQGWIEFVVAGETIEEIASFYEILNDNILKKYIMQVKEEPWNRPTQYGFEFIDGYHMLSKRELEEKIKDLEKELSIVERELNRVSSQITKMKNSNTWRLLTRIKRVIKSN